MPSLSAIGLGEAIIPLQYHPRALIKLCQDKGIALDHLLEDTGIQASHTDKLWHLISYQQYCTLINNALNLTGEQDLGLQFGYELSLGANGIIGFAMFTGKTVGDSLEMSTRYKKLISPITRIRYETSGQTLYVLAENTMASSELEAFFIETLISTLARWFSDIAPSYSGDFTFTFKHPKPDYADKYYEQFGDNIIFNAERNAIICNADLLDIPLKHAHDFAAKEAFKVLSERIKQIASKEGLIAIARDTLAKYEKPPQLEQLAKQLELSPTTLKRKLKEHGTSFQHLLDDVKRERAIKLLREGQLSIQDIAEQLGYYSISNFRRAFKKWTQATPSAYKNHDDS